MQNAEPTVARRHRLKAEGRKHHRPHFGQLRQPRKGPKTLALKNHFVAMLGEYVGTVLFMIFALGGTNVANIPATSVTSGTTEGQDGSTAATANTSNLLYIALSFGFSLAVNAWIFFRVSGGLFNPAVSLGMALVGALTPLRAALLSVSQILGGITGAAIIQAITPGTLNVRTQLGAGTTVVQGLFMEMFLTSLLMIAILLLAAEKHKATFIAPIGIGLALFVAELLGVYYTGGSLNPARSFGPNVVLATFDTYHWIYWLGPCMGACLAAGFYRLLKWLQYETVLGPEDGEVVPARGAMPGDIGNISAAEKGEGIGLGEGGDNDDGGRGNMMAVSGPGLGDLLTAGDAGEVFDLNHATRLNEERMERIEDMLYELLEQREAQELSRTSQHTAVDDQFQEGVLAGQPLKTVKSPRSPRTPRRSVSRPIDGQNTDGFADGSGPGLGRDPAVDMLRREGVAADVGEFDHPFKPEIRGPLPK